MESKMTDIEEYDLSRITPRSGICIIGKTACGKSTLMYDIMLRLASRFYLGLAMTPSLSSYQKFQSCIPRHFIKEPVTSELETFVDLVRQDHRHRMNGEIEQREYFFIADDCGFDKQFMNSKVLRQMMMNGRNFNLFRLLVIQYLMAIGPDLRSNIDLIFLFWDNNVNNQKKMHANWFSFIPFPKWQKMFATVTRNYGTMVLDVRKCAVSHNYRDCVFFYRAEMHDLEPFQMCHPSFFEISNKTFIDRDSATQVMARTGGGAAAAPRVASDDDDNESQVRLISIDGEIMSQVGSTPARRRSLVVHRPGHFDPVHHGHSSLPIGHGVEFDDDEDDE